MNWVNAWGLECSPSDKKSTSVTQAGIGGLIAKAAKIGYTAVKNFVKSGGLQRAWRKAKGWFGKKEKRGTFQKTPKNAKPRSLNFGKHKSSEKWANQMKQRGWSESQIDDAIQNGQKFEAPNNINPGNGATRHVNPDTGRSVVTDNNKRNSSSRR